MAEKLTPPITLSRTEGLIAHLSAHWQTVCRGPRATTYAAWESQGHYVLSICEELGWNRLAMLIFRVYVEAGVTLTTEFARHVREQTPSHREAMRTWFGKVVETVTRDTLPKPHHERADRPLPPSCEAMVEIIETVTVRLVPLVLTYHSDDELDEHLRRLAACRCRQEECHQAWIEAHRGRKRHRTTLV